MEATLDKFGRIVIPKEIRDDFNLKPGSQMRIEESQQAIILKPVAGEPNLHCKDGVLVFSGTPTGDLDKALEKHREGRIKNLRQYMKILFDTSVIIAGLVESHPMHKRAFPWLKRAKEKKFELVVASHAIAELYAVSQRNMFFLINEIFLEFIDKQ